MSLQSSAATDSGQPAPADTGAAQQANIAPPQTPAVTEVTGAPDANPPEAVPSPQPQPQPPADAAQPTQTSGTVPPPAATAVPGPEPVVSVPAADGGARESPAEQPKGKPPSPPPAPARVAPRGPHAFRVRPITFFRRTVNVLLQDENGPCPLLALCNILSLRGQLDIAALSKVEADGKRYARASALTNAVASFIMDRLERKRTAAEGDSAVREHTFEEALEALPQFVQGMNINVRFYSVDAFEASREVAVLDAAGVELVHGWIIDDADAAVRAEVGPTVAYNAMMDKACAGQAPVFRTWLDDNATQLTVAGLFALMGHLREGEVCMLFRNNHYGVITRHNNALFTLVTDCGLVDASPEVVWEALRDVDGSAGSLLNDSFRSPCVRGAATAAAASSNGAPRVVQAIPLAAAAADDEALARALQREEEDQFVAEQRQLQQRAAEHSRTPPPAPGTSPVVVQARTTPPPPPPPRQPRKQPKDDSCVIT